LEKVIRREIKDAAVEKKKAKTPRAPNPALTRKYILTDQLSVFMKSPSATRQDVLKRVWEYVNQNGLKDANSPGKVRVDYALRGFLGSGDANGVVGNTEIMKLLAPHFLRPE
jgi:chromatin remodeling complex protein RSC6